MCTQFDPTKHLEELIKSGNIEMGFASTWRRRFASFPLHWDPISFTRQDVMFCLYFQAHKSPFNLR